MSEKIQRIEPKHITPPPKQEKPPISTVEKPAENSIGTDFALDLINQSNEYLKILNINLIDQLNQFEHAKLISKLLEFPKKEFYVAGMVAILLHEKELDLGKWVELYEIAKGDRRLKRDQGAGAYLQKSLKNEVDKRKLDRVREEAKRMYHEHNPKPQPNFEAALKGDPKPPPSRSPLLDLQNLQERAKLRRELLDLRPHDRNSKPPTEELVNNVLWFAYEGGFHENFEPYLAGIREGYVLNPAGWLQKFVNDAKASRSTGTCESIQQMAAKIGVKEPHVKRSETCGR